MSCSQVLRERFDNQAEPRRAAWRARRQKKAFMADGVGYMQVLGRDNAAFRDPVHITFSEVGDADSVARP
jgi:hypothetical protein